VYEACQLPAIDKRFVSTAHHSMADASWSAFFQKRLLHLLPFGAHGLATALQVAVDELEVSGFDRATISVLASNDKVKERVGHLYREVGEIEDDPQAPQTAIISKHSLAEGEGAAIGLPSYIGGVAGAFAVVASGGTLAASVAAAVAGGAAGVGLGAVLARTIGQRYKHHALEQLEEGGMVMWVSVRDKRAERRAIEILTKAGARDVHMHEVEREWTLKDRPLSEVQPDPLLEHDK
jgi:hypothetical protein